MYASFFDELGLYSPSNEVEILADNARTHAPIPKALGCSSSVLSHADSSHSSHGGGTARREQQSRWDSNGSSNDSLQSPTSIMTVYFRDYSRGAIQEDTESDTDSEEERPPNCRWTSGGADPFQQSPDQMRLTRRHLNRAPRRDSSERMLEQNQNTATIKKAEPLRPRRVRSLRRSVPALPGSLDS